MIRRIGLLLALMTPVAGFAAVGALELEHADNDIGDLNSLQRGASLFMSYCFGCHSAKYVRYSRLQTDLDLSQTELRQHLMFAADKPHDTMTTAIPAADAAIWFGQSPPDLSLTARSRGSDWIYTYLKNFYVDDTRTLGVNNLFLPGASMPHALWELEGIKQAVFTEQEDSAGNIIRRFDRYETVTPGTITAEKFDEAVRDLVNFLEYIAEPVQHQRQSLGIKVILFLLGFLFLTYFLKREYWKDVH